MQWDTSPHAGFSTVEPWLPLAADWRHETVENQLADATSLLNLYRRLTALRRSRPALTHGSYHPVAASGDLLVYIRAHEGERILVALNLGGDPVALGLKDENMKGRLLVSSLGDRDGEAVNESIDLRGHEGAVIGFDR
jgi:alpha-glucosidase